MSPFEEVTRRYKGITAFSLNDHWFKILFSKDNFQIVTHDEGKLLLTGYSDDSWIAHSYDERLLRCGRRFETAVLEKLTGCRSTEVHSQNLLLVDNGKHLDYALPLIIGLRYRFRNKLPLIEGLPSQLYVPAELVSVLDWMRTREPSETLPFLLNSLSDYAMSQAQACYHCKLDIYKALKDESVPSFTQITKLVSRKQRSTTGKPTPRCGPGWLYRSVLTPEEQQRFDKRSKFLLDPAPPRGNNARQAQWMEWQLLTDKDTGNMISQWELQRRFLKALLYELWEKHAKTPDVAYITTGNTNRE